jgi:hypothetical protein
MAAVAGYLVGFNYATHRTLARQRQDRQRRFLLRAEQAGDAPSLMAVPGDERGDA